MSTMNVKKKNWPLQAGQSVQLTKRLQSKRDLYTYLVNCVVGGHN